MEILILSCGTGGGHNAAGKAVADELRRRGHQVTFTDPYLLAGRNVANLVSDSYVRLVQRSPGLFGKMYSLGESYRQLPIHSPVYWVNGKMASVMGEYLDAHHFDLIIMSHMYPAHILTNLKQHRLQIPSGNAKNAAKRRNIQITRARWDMFSWGLCFRLPLSAWEFSSRGR